MADEVKVGKKIDELAKWWLAGIFRAGALGCLLFIFEYEVEYHVLRDKAWPGIVLIVAAVLWTAADWATGAVEGSCDPAENRPKASGN